MVSLIAILPVGVALFLFIAVLVWLIVRVISLGNEVEQLKQRHNAWLAQAPGGQSINPPHGEYVNPRGGETPL